MDKLRLLAIVTCALLFASLVFSIAALAVPEWTIKENNSTNGSWRSTIGLWQFCGSQKKMDGCLTHWSGAGTEIDAITGFEWFQACSGLMLFGAVATLVGLVLVCWQCFSRKTFVTVQLIAGILMFCAGVVKAMLASLWMMMFSGTYPLGSESSDAIDYCQKACSFGAGPPLAIVAAVLDLMACVLATKCCWMRADVPVDEKPVVDGPYDIDDKGVDGPYQYEIHD